MPVRAAASRWRNAALVAWLFGCVARAATPAWLDPDSARFRHHDTSSGLSQDSVLAIAEDRDGLLWFGTQDGLNRYDGFDTTVFRPRRGDPSALPAAWVGALARDRDGQLWLGTPAGLARFDPAHERFLPFHHDPDDPASVAGDAIYVLFVDAVGRFWIGNDGGLSRWLPQRAAFENHRPNGPDDHRFRAIADAGAGELWLGTVDGLSRFDPATGTFSAAAPALDEPVTALVRSRDGSLWAGTERAGLWRLPPGGSWQHWRHDAGDPASLSHDHVRALLEDRDGRLWIGTEAGLDRLDPEAGGFAHYRHVRHDAGALGKGPVVALHGDQDGHLWIGSWEGGASLLAPERHRMLSFGEDVPAMAALASPSVRALAAEDDQLWLGTEAGLYLLDPSSRRVRPVPATAGLYLFAMQVERERIWLASRDGLRVLDRDDERLHVPPGPANVVRGRVRRLWRDGGRGWYGVEGDGLYVLADDGRVLASHPFSGLVTFIAPFSADSVLVGAQDGLYWLDRDDAGIRFRIPLGDAEGGLPAPPACYLRARDGSHWLGTSGSGLLRMHLDDPAQPDGARFDVFDRRRGLRSDLIGALFEDEVGDLWLSTTDGLARFQRSDGRFRSYDRHEGALERSYWIGAGTRLPGGGLAFGGFEGFTLVDPAALRRVQPPQVPRLVGLELDGRPVPAGSTLLPQALASTDLLRLSWADARSLRLHFAGVDPVLPSRIGFRYRLEDFDPNWSHTDASQRTATYTNLPPGRYRFRVVAENSDGLPSATAAELALEIVPLWWQTWWARGSAALALLLLGLAALQHRLQRGIREQQRLEREVAERTADIVRLAEIGRELTATLDVEQAMDRVFDRVSARLDTHVFGIVLYQRDEARLHVVYAVEAGLRQSGLEFSMDESNRPAVWCVRERRELITGHHEQLLEYVQEILPVKTGARTESIVYLPLAVGERVVGCLTVQSLRRDAYDDKQLEFLRVLASYTAIALDNATNYGRLDQMVAERTADLLALGEIGRELTATLNVDAALGRVHARVAAMLDAYVFSVGRYEPEQQRIVRLYAVEGGVRSESAAYDMSELDRPAVWCVRHGREVIAQTLDELQRYVGPLPPPKIGAPTESVVYLPLVSDNEVRGYLSVQSLRPHAYSESQLEFLRVLTSYTAIAVENALSFAHLDEMVAARTAELRRTLEELRSTQQQLIEREKMASLGGLVAGVAHEVNTPLGIALTSASHLREVAGRLFAQFDAGRLTRGQMAEFRRATEEGMRLILGSLERARQLIASFKQVAVDQSSEQRRRVALAELLDEILFSLRPTYRQRGLTITVDCPPHIVLDTYPGALFQILTNLITNAVLHAYPDGPAGAVAIVVRDEVDAVEISFRDDGVGMDATTAAQAFDPFFTTRRGSGGSGLGLHLVYNLVTQLLGGSIVLDSRPGAGSRFLIRLPVIAPTGRRAEHSSAEPARV